MILCVGVSNVHFQSFSSIFKDLFFAMLSEMAVDWIKHSFIIKFNLISQRTYTSHLEHLAMSALKITCEKSSSNGDFLAKRFSFLPLPLFIMIIYVITESVFFKTSNFGLLFILYTCIILFLLKILTGLLLLIMVTYWSKAKIEHSYKTKIIQE
uniref:Transmembrane anterior posterior transformation protein 1 (Trinotate prediction) n=1 Tax=Henneguya salminicola TaxID=69463 RepID=A0A6G3MIZ8_HENSL